MIGRARLLPVVTRAAAPGARLGALFSTAREDADAAALSELKEAARAGDAEAQYQLSAAYGFGELGVEESEEKALHWVRAAAEQGLDHAQYHLGMMHQFGLSGLDVSASKARELLELAAVQGNADAMFQLSCLYMPSEFTYNNSDDNSDDQGMLDTPLSAAMSKVADEETSDNPSNNNGRSDDVDEQVSEALLWVTRAAKKGHADAQFNLGIIHLRDDYPGVKKSEVTARRLLQKSAKQGHADAQFSLGCMFVDGIGGLRPSFGKALKLFEMAAGQGHEDAAGAVLELSGKGAEADENVVTTSNTDEIKSGSVEDFEKMVRNISHELKQLELSDDDIKKLVEQDQGEDHPWTEDELSKLSSGEDLDVEAMRSLLMSDEEMRSSLLKDAEEHGDVEAAFMVGCMMLEGIGGEEDHSQAKRWFRVAAADGHQDAQDMLDQMRLDS